MYLWERPEWPTLTWDVGGLVPADRNVEGVVEMMLDATEAHYRKAPAAGAAPAICW